jgi:tetratricopeptide (TPR) repeat protein
LFINGKLKSEHARMKLAPFMLILVLVNNSLAQDIQRIDSLRKLEAYKRGSELYPILNEIAWEYRFLNQDSTIRYAQRAYTLGTKLGLKQTLARPLNFMGVASEYKGEAIEAYEYYKQALQVATAQRDEAEIAYANNNMGRLMFNQGNISRASSHYDRALKLFESLHDPVGIGYVYLNLALLYEFQKDYKNAEEYFLKVDAQRGREGTERRISSLMQLGRFYKAFNELKKSNQYFAKADSLCALIHDEVFRTEVSILLAENRLKEGNINQAGAFARKAWDYANKQKLTRQLDGADFIMGKVAFSRNDLEEAKKYFLKVVNSAKPFKDVPLKMDAHYFLGQIYSRQGQRDKELLSTNQYLMLRDSAKEQDLAKQLSRLEFQYKLELEQHKKENELLKTIESRNQTIIRKQQILNVIYAVALLIIFVIVIVLYRNIRLKQKHSAEIERMNASLENLVEKRTQTIQEQNVVLREYAYFNAHQIRGPLARILGLISVLDLEFNRESFGPYVNMLQEAGTDLDKAIKEINTRLNTADQ